MATNNSKPAAELRIGAVKATVWENEIGGITRHNITFSRLYKDGEQWKTTQTFGRNDLLILSESGRSDALADLRNSAGRRRPGRVTGAGERRPV